MIDADELDKVKFHPLPYTHITPSDVEVESYKRGWNDAVDAIMTEAPTIEPDRKGKWIRHPEVKNVYGGKCIECSECHTKYVVMHIEDELFCRCCGSCNAEEGEQE